MLAEPERLILHVDMDAFFASVEQLDHPELRGRAVIVGGSVRGVVSACSYEARKAGVHSAMPITQARRLCPHGAFVPVRMQRYVQVSRLVMAVLDRFSPLVEQASVDEAYLDVTGQERIFGPPEDLGMALKKAVCSETGLTCSVGIAPVKFLAKIASDFKKPDGLFILRQNDVQSFLNPLPVAKIPGIGPKALEQLTGLGVHTVRDVLRFPEKTWRRKFGKMGRMLYERAQGIDAREVVREYESKSESAENTLARDSDDREELKSWLLDQAERVARRLRRDGKKGRTVTLKVKFCDFKTNTRSKTLSEATHSTDLIFETVTSLLGDEKLPRQVRLVGVGVSNFSDIPQQLSFLDQTKSLTNENLDKALDAIRKKFGSDALVRGRIFNFRKNRDS